MEPATLMNGPRGRRVCLAFAMVADTDVDRAAEMFAGGVDEAHGAVQYSTSRSAQPGYTVQLSDAVGLGEPARPGKPPQPGTVAGSVATALERAELPDVTNDVLWNVLESAVDTAYYWEEPDGLDTLTFQPEITIPLSRVAAHIAASSLTWWWSAPMAKEQWAVKFADPLHDGDEPDRRTAAQISADWRAEAVRAESRSTSDLRTDVRANISGEWWSMPPDALTSSTRTERMRGPVGLYLVEDSFGPEHATVTALEPAGSVYEIDSSEAFAELCRRYPFDVTASRRHDWFRVTARDGRWVIPDWRAVAEDWDAVHLTIAAYLETAGRPVPVSGDAASVLAGWEPDATYWLRDSYRLTGKSTMWSYDDEAEVWHPAIMPG